MQYTTERTTRAIPPLQYKQGQETLVAEDFKEQYTAFRTTLFSSPPTTRVSLNWKGYSTDPSWKWLSRLDPVEVYNAIFTSSPHKAPRTDQLSFAILQRAYNTSAIALALTLLYQLLFTIGYHPKRWQEAIRVILLKANK